MIPIWVCNIRLQTKKKQQQKKTKKTKKTKNQKIKLKKKCDTGGSHLETGITLQYH